MPDTPETSASKSPPEDAQGKSASPSGDAAIDKTQDGGLLSDIKDAYSHFSAAIKGEDAEDDDPEEHDEHYEETMVMTKDDSKRVRVVKRKRNPPEVAKCREISGEELIKSLESGKKLSAVYIRELRIEGAPGDPLLFDKPIEIENSVIDLIAFHAVEFKRHVIFKNCLFRKNLYIGEKRQYMATLYGFDVILAAAVFRRSAKFEGCFFDGRLDALGTKFLHVASFASSKFMGKAYFNRAVFEGEADFHNIEVFSPQFRISEALFRALANFRYSKWNVAGYFINTEFRGIADFSHTIAKEGTLYFTEAQFHNTALFEKCVFHHHASFVRAEFHRLAVFIGCNFKREMDFTRTKFLGPTDFHLIAIESIPILEGAKFHDEDKLVLTPEEKKLWKEEIKVGSINDWIIIVLATAMIHSVVYACGAGKAVNLFLFYTLAGIGNLYWIAFLQSAPAIGGTFKKICNKMTKILDWYRPKAFFTEMKMWKELPRVFGRSMLFPFRFFGVWFSGLMVNVVLVTIFFLYNMFIDDEFGLKKFLPFFIVYMPLYTVLTPMFCFFRFYNNPEERYRTIFTRYLVRRYGDDWENNGDAMKQLNRYRGRWPKVYAIDYLHIILLLGMFSAIVVNSAKISYERLALGIIGEASGKGDMKVEDLPFANQFLGMMPSGVKEFITGEAPAAQEPKPEIHRTQAAAERLQSREEQNEGPAVATPEKPKPQIEFIRRELPLPSEKPKPPPGERRFGNLSRGREVTPPENRTPPANPLDKPDMNPQEQPSEATADQPSEAPAEQPSEAPAEQPSEAPADQPSEAPAEQPSEAPAEQPSEAPAEQPSEAPAEQGAEPPAEGSGE
ncbi:MAG: hypothetical protein NUW37_19260 [Planctomycetes bacterium]|nr:hypothetical protein [Planctomycetota bacterium]